jgi:hypothetical protein
MAVFWLPELLLPSAPSPKAVFWSPVVLLSSALTPLAVLALPVVLKTSALTPLAVLGAARAIAKERLESDRGVVDACGVANERVCPQTGVGLRPRNPRQRKREYERNNKDGEKPSPRMAKHIIPSLFVELSLLLEQPRQRQLVY